MVIVLSLKVHEHVNSLSEISFMVLMYVTNHFQTDLFRIRFSQCSVCR